MASPRAHVRQREEHLARCSACAHLAARVNELDRDIHEAALVPPPDGLTHRILMDRAARPTWRFAAAAALLSVTIAVVLILPHVIDSYELAGPAEAVGPAHPGVAAIALVADEEPSTVDSGRIGHASEVTSSLKRLGLTLNDPGGTTYYVGKCHMSGGNCDHLLVSTPGGYANVLLLQDHPVLRRVLVADRSMIALVNPAPNGGYIVVAKSPKLAKRTARLFRRG